MRVKESLITPRLVGERMRLAHFHFWWSLFRNPDVTANDGRVWTPDRIAAGFWRQIARWETNGLGYWTFSRDGELIGISGLREHPQGVELGYAVSPEHRGKGMATEMARAVLEAAGPGPVFARTRITHAVSRHILEKLGFAFEREEWLGGILNALYRRTARIAARRRSSAPGATHV